MSTGTLYPLKFHPIFKDRVWGGAMLKRLYGKLTPAGVPIGESWEISDRPGDGSVIANGVHAGRDLRWLMENYGKELLGDRAVPGGRFPLLIKLLDAREKLSLQVHPPASKASLLGGEPKTELWYVAHADPGAELFVGLRLGVTREEFERRVGEATVADCFHRVPVQAGDAMFLPSGRVHAIGGGLVIFEIQQNSDTTYRVFDWNRVGLDGKPRTLHVRESLECINWTDFEPDLVPQSFSGSSELQRRVLVNDPLFEIEELRLGLNAACKAPNGSAQVLGVVSGAIQIRFAAMTVVIEAGEFCLLPAAIKEAILLAEEPAIVLKAALP